MAIATEEAVASSANVAKTSSANVTKTSRLQLDLDIVSIVGVDVYTGGLLLK